ncbi:MAG: hypothetical protein IPL27_26725 [Lewinellaceae bacterium]|nr:hypothetical protein [Lewinellaceae bacterium]
MKDWTLESIFNDRGAKREVWEVPDLFQLPLNDRSQQHEMDNDLHGMGPNRMQYWVGDFDGSTFTLDTNDNLLTGKHVRGELLADFENGFGGWTVGGLPSANHLPPARCPTSNRWMVSRVSATSTPFTVAMLLPAK